MKVLSLFDGMSCALLAMQGADIPIERYVAYEIDKYAIQTAQHNFPNIEQKGDVFEADFTEFKGFDYLMGGSPCTYWSIAQKNNRETEASGQGWELFSQYVRALKEAEPKYFVYENNKSMSSAIRESITETFGFEPICINSALVSAQNRQRLYWVGKRNADGTYSKVEIEQPDDRKIVLKDILEDGLVEKDKAYCLKHQAGNARDYFKKHHTQIKFEPVSIDETHSIKSNESYIQYDLSGKNFKSQDQRAYYPNSKHGTLTYSSTQSKTGVIEPVSYSIPIEFNEQGEPTMAVSPNDGKTYKVYKVMNGLITIKDKQYPIKLADGFYIIRKLTVRECMRLQTVPEWYEFPVSDTQAYKMLGNGWTVEVIIWLLQHTKERKGNYEY